MRNALLVLLLIPLLGAGCTSQFPDKQTSRVEPQIGFNFIRFYSGLPDDDVRGEINRDERATQPEAIFEDFETLGAQAYRQLTKADVGWSNVEPRDDEWNFRATDDAIKNAPIEPIVTLFSLQYASPNPPWATRSSTFQKELGEDAIDYVTTVVNRYKDHVKYWEIGNEMDHWRAADNPSSTPAGAKLPAVLPEDGFSPEEQGVFMKQVADIIRANDPDAVILMPGMSGLDSYIVNTWLPGVIKGGGTEWFDVVNYHYYGPWDKYENLRHNLSLKLSALELIYLPIWNTETGSTSDPTLTTRTNYPNSEESQAADIFRRILPAYGMGDDAVFWHTYIGSKGTGDNLWRDYGVISAEGEQKLSYHAFKLFTDELIPFSYAQRIFASPTGLNVYEVMRKDGDKRYVVWGNGTWELPENILSSVSVTDKTTTWTPVTGDHIELTATPVLLK